MFATTCIHAYGRIGRDSRPITHGYHHAAAYGGAVPTETAQILGIGPRVRDMHLMDGLERGYLPQEIPPCFTSKDFASKARSLARIDPKSWTLPAKFSIARAGGVRRSAEIPNPFAQLLLIELCEKNWTTLQRITARSEISLSRPVRGNHVRSMAYRHPISEWGRQLVGRMPGGRVTLKTDISQFYPSIYTHAVDWAIRGKRKAKARLREIGLGPDLDLRLRNSRGGQTIGLSVGPDTSWLVAELILARIDEDLLKKFPRIAPRCARFGDDMTVARGALNFHVGQKQAILNAIVAHEVLATTNLLALYQQVAPDALLAGNRMNDLAQAKHAHPKYCFKMATGTGKTWVLQALLIWQLLNKTFVLVYLVMAQQVTMACIVRPITGGAGRNVTMDYRLTLRSIV